MESWGTGSFENDAATAFILEVVEDGSVAVEEALEVALDPDITELAAEEGARAVAAAEIVHVHLSGDTAQVTDAGLRAWLSELEEGELSELRDLALEALDRVVGPGSELPELWEDGPSETSRDATEWRAELQRLRAGLEGQTG
ncbi:DUF4259 domain-containing protein [Deinococcus altitudinis]|uniref:DUF4259 domain-containing protein n=1 Tax=Deinococcus altitudinis TaxID=468914 RepID=UPI003891E51E